MNKRSKQDATLRQLVPSSPPLQSFQVIELPSWIRTSEFVEQYEVDFPGQPIELPPERNFPLPTKVNKRNIESVLDNVRFFGVRDCHITRLILNFLIQLTVDDIFVERLKSNFGELEVIWNNVLFCRARIYYLLDAEFCSQAAERNLLMCLEYAHDSGCPWNEETCSAAAHNGHLDCLIFAHENDVHGINKHVQKLLWGVFLVV
jgi:hypothetical protein